jgi:hypothetical protein
MNAIARMKIIEIRTEIEQLRETVAAQAADIKILEIEFGDVRDSYLYCKGKTQAQAAVIESLKRAIGDWDRAETPSELQSAEAGLLKALAIPTDSTRILDEVQRAERERCAKVCEDQANEPECPERAMYCAEAIRAME